MNYFKIATLIISSKTQELIRLGKLASAVALVAVLMLTAACVRPGPRAADPNANFSDPTKPDANQSAATFYNEEVTGNSIVTQNLKGFSIPTEKLFSFRTCVFDKRLRESIKGHQFVIKGGEKEIEVRSEESGCLNWSEPISFNGTQNAKYIPLKRTIIAKGMHSGARDLAICINPWNYDGSEAVRDCARRPVPVEMLVPIAAAPSYLRGEEQGGDQLKRYLWVDDLRMNSIHNPGGVDGSIIDFSISIGPKVLTRNIRGDEEAIALKDGIFSVQLWIVAKTGIGRCMVIAKSDPSMELAMVGGRLREELKMKVRYLISYGQLELVGAIRPKNGPESILPYDGVWTLGDHTGLLGMKFGFERPPAYKNAPGEFSAKKYVEGCIDVSEGVKESDVMDLIGTHAKRSVPAALNMGTPDSVFAGGGLKVTPAAGGKVEIEAPRSLLKSEKSAAVQKVQVDQDLMRDECPDATDLPRLFPQDHAKRPIIPGPDLLTCVNKSLQSGVYKVEQFEFSPVDVRPEPIMDPVDSETTIDRKMKYRVITRVTNPLAQNQPVRDMEFTVETQDGTSRQVRTNHLGELIFNDTIYHVYYEPERFYLKTVKISHPSGFSKRLAIVLVPWDNNGFQFARDIRGLSKQTIAQMNLVPRPPSQLLLTNFNWGTIGFRYQVDNYLSLKVYKQFMLTLDPRVLRYSSFTHGRMQNEPLRDGLYLMKVALQKDYQPIGLEPQEFISGIRTLVAVRAGRINVPVEVMFRDFRVVKLRTNLLIELATVDERKLPIEIREAAFNLRREFENKSAKAEDIQELEKDFYNIVKEKTKVKMDSLDAYIAKSSGLAERTFVGVVVPYSNGFSAALRPSDELLEVSCPTGNTVDCDEIKSNDVIPPSERSERAKLFGDIKHLYRMSVSRLLDRMQVLERKYVSEMTEKTKMSKILKMGNLEYLAFTNEAAFMQQSLKADPELSKNNQVLPMGGGFQRFANQYTNFDPQEKFNQRELVEAYNRLVWPDYGTRTAMTAPVSPRVKASAKAELESLSGALFDIGLLKGDQAARLCVFLAENLIMRHDPDAMKGLSFTEKAQARMRLNEFNRQCLLSSLSGSSLQLERKLRVFRLVDAERGGGNLMSLNVGASTSYGRSEGWSFGYSLSPLKPLTGALDAAAVVTGPIGLVAGGAAKFIDISGVGINMSTSKSGDISDGASVSGGANLAVELRRMDLTMAGYERCAVVRLSPHLARSFAAYAGSYLKNAGIQDFNNHTSRGLMVCEGFERKEPFKFEERYYQFSQMIGDEILNDPTALENQPFNFGLRGRSDYVRLVRTIEARPASIFKLPDHISVGELPISRLMSVFGEATPTYPGLISLEPQILSRLKPVMSAKDLDQPAKK
jgi:hypothetical protein